jgi:hypothetical protein
MVACVPEAFYVINDKIAYNLSGTGCRFVLCSWQRGTHPPLYAVNVQLNFRKLVIDAFFSKPANLC